jgi:Fe-S-cluster containining protein
MTFNFIQALPRASSFAPISYECTECIIVCYERDNILFGKAFDEVKYAKVIKACALQDDFDQFDAG